MVFMFTNMFTYSNTHYVNSGNFYYSPSNLTINVGDTVTWINDGGFHNVNFDVSAVTGQSYNNPEVFVSPPTLSLHFTHMYLQSWKLYLRLFSRKSMINGMVEKRRTVNGNSNSTSLINVNVETLCLDLVCKCSCWMTTIANTIYFKDIYIYYECNKSSWTTI